MKQISNTLNSAIFFSAGILAAVLITFSGCYSAADSGGTSSNSSAASSNSEKPAKTGSEQVKPTKRNKIKALAGGEEDAGPSRDFGGN